MEYKTIKKPGDLCTISEKANQQYYEQWGMEHDLYGQFMVVIENDEINPYLTLFHQEIGDYIFLHKDELVVVTK